MKEEEVYCENCDEIITEINNGAECPRCSDEVCFLCRTGHFNSGACGSNY
jgi:hypothetical protein